MEDFPTFNLTFAVAFVEILANFATPAANFATRFRHISHSRYLCPTKNKRQIFKTHLLLLVCDHSKKVEALSVADNTDLPQAVRKVTGSWGPITTYLCFGNLVHVYDGTCIPAVRDAPKLYRKVCDRRRKICENFHKFQRKSQIERVGKSSTIEVFEIAW